MSSSLRFYPLPGLHCLLTSQPLAGRFIHLGYGPDGAQKAEGTEKGNAGISPGPRSRRGDESWADGLKQAMWEGWAIAKVWAESGLAETWLCPVGDLALLPSSILSTLSKLSDLNEILPP